MPFKFCLNQSIIGPYAAAHCVSWLDLFLSWCKSVPMDDWDDFRLILAVHKGKTLRHAAKILGVSHATVSRRLSRINQKFGAVFEPVANGLRPTKFGNDLIDHAMRIERLVEEVETIRTAETDELAGPITLSMPPILVEYLLLDDLAQFSNEFPGIELNLDTNSAYTNLDESEADVVVRCTDRPLDHLYGRRICVDAFTFYAHPSYLSKPANDWRWLAGTPQFDDLSWIKQSPFPDVAVGMKVKNIQARYHAAIAGHGMVFLPCFMGDQCEELERVSEAKLITDREFWILSHSSGKDIPRMRVLRQFLASAMKKKADLIEGRAA